jgi:DNA (cytosine-5)-methyltransferase 1
MQSIALGDLTSTEVRASFSQITTMMGKLTRAARHAAVITLQKVRYKGGELRSRINIENQRQLKASGFSAGTRFEVTYKAGLVEIVASDQGSNIISPKRFAKRDGTEETGERLDLRSLQIHEKFAGEERILALYLDKRVVFLHIPTVARGLARVEQLLEAVERKELRTAALYAGIGTLDAALHDGFKKAGIHSEMVLANEILPEATDAMLNDNPATSARTRTFNCGIEEFIASGRTIETPDLVALGIPCKGASRLNVATRDLPEMHPWAGHQVINAVMALQKMGFPPVVLVENVTAYADTVSLSMLRRVLEEQGYKTELIGDVDEAGVYRGINSNDYSDIERRVRMALLAYPAGITLTINMVKSGKSTLTVGDIRLPENEVSPEEYEKGLHLNSEEKKSKGWKNRIVSDSDNVTPSMSSDCWKQRVEDPKFVHPTDPTKCRLPLPEEHAALKGHDPRLIRSLGNSHAHSALGNGTAKKCWTEFARALGVALQESAGSMRQYLQQFEAGLEFSMKSIQGESIQTEPSLF